MSQNEESFGNETLNVVKEELKVLSLIIIEMDV